MMYKTKGIILKRTNLGEADRILTIFTEKKGKVKAIAKGVRKTLSKLAGHLEPFCLTNFVIAEGRNLDTITDAEIVKCFIRLRSNLASTNTAYYIGEVIEGLTAENEAHPEVLHLLEQVLEHVDNGKDKLLRTYFEINLLSKSGFRPELKNCVRCGKKILPNGNYYNFRDGGLTCGNCGGEKRISNEAIKVLRLFLQHKISLIQKIKTKKELALEVEDLTSTYLEYISQKEFKSKRFLPVAK